MDAPDERTNERTDKETRLFVHPSVRSLVSYTRSLTQYATWPSQSTDRWTYTHISDGYSL